jgi:integrase
VERSAEKRGRLADLSKPVRLDLCRHSYASTMVAAGVDPGEVMRRMGHSTIALRSTATRMRYAATRRTRGRSCKLS